MAIVDKLTAVADAIRYKTGKTDPLTLDQMVTEVEGIETGGGGSSIPNGSRVTFGYENGIPAEREALYAIQSTDLNELGAITQKMSGKKALVTVSDMIRLLNQVQFIPRGNAESVSAVTNISSAVGILPTVYRGVAVSAQSISNTSRAVGSLVEPS